MLTVACVCVPGGIYHEGHVERLRQMVERHLSLPFSFEVIRESPFPGWWAKVSLFEPRRFFGRVLYLDLDVTVVGSLNDLAELRAAPIYAISDYQRPLTVNSSVMVWRAGHADAVYTRFTPDVMGRLHGDQDWINECVRPARFPRRWCPSFKRDVQPAGRVPTDARVVVFHGKPKPWEVDCSIYS